MAVPLVYPPRPRASPGGEALCRYPIPTAPNLQGCRHVAGTDHLEVAHHAVAREYKRGTRGTHQHNVDTFFELLSVVILFFWEENITRSL